MPDPPPFGADVVALTRWLCDVPSPIGEERALCDALIERAKQWKFSGELTRLGDSFAIPIARGEGSRVALVGHLDVVRTSHDAPPRTEGDRLYGPGAADMKSGLALMIAAAEDRALAIKGEVTLIFYAREEGPFAENELGPFLATHPGIGRQDLAICLEPSYSKLQLGCMGSLHATVTFKGKTSHSARPWQGKNAIYESWPFLRDLQAREPVAATIDGMPYKAVMSATMAKAGRGRNVIPDSFELNVNYRFLPGVSIEEAKAHVHDAVAGRAEVVFTDESPSALPHRSHPLVSVLINAGVKAVESKQAWTDVARFAQLGVAAVNFGPGDQDEAHQRNESTSIAGLHEGWSILRRFLERI